MLALAYGGYSPVKAEGKNYSDYVNPLMGTLSEHQLSTGNTYPARHQRCCPQCDSSWPKYLWKQS